MAVMMKMRVYDYPRERKALERAFQRKEMRNSQLEETVAGIIEDVRLRGDVALAEYTEKFDGRRLGARAVKVAPADCAAAWRKLPREIAHALEYARDGIERFHRRQVRKGYVLKSAGVRLEQRVRPLGRAGVYVPGGRACYPSTLLMNVIPAQVAGVKEIIVATPPVQGMAEDFVPLAAAHMLGVSNAVYQMGGAQAIAAMAYGTTTIPKVDKVVGPGNAYVAAAKRMLYGIIDIDSVAGESEVLIIADGTARPDYIAADLIAQAEHTGGETAVLVGMGKSFDFDAVEDALREQLRVAPRKAQATQSLKSGGVFVRVANGAQAAEVANQKAPEHIEIIARGAEEIADAISNVGAIFIGSYTPEAVGDYVAGPNHILPTGGTARFFSPLGVDDFYKTSNVLNYSASALRRATPHVVTLAECEGLSGHAQAVRVRMKS